MDMPPGTGLIFGVGSLLLMIHVFTFNDWADFTRGVHHSNSAMLQLESRNISPRLLLMFSLISLFVSLGFFSSLSLWCGLISAGIAGLDVCYSHPAINLKSVPVVSTLVHFTGGLVYFLLGYSLFTAVDPGGVLIGLFFGLTLAAGHPIQEARDFDEDRRVEAKTNAIVFGRNASFLAGLVFFTGQYACLFAVAWANLIPRFLAVLPVICWPVHVWWWLGTFRSGLTPQNISRFQLRYRILYVAMGLAILLSLFFIRSF